MNTSALEIIICMGSSCFSRGNNRNIAIIERMLGKAVARNVCKLEGHLCQNSCTRGPNISINGKVHNEVDPVTLMALLAPYAGDDAGDDQTGQRGET